MRIQTIKSRKPEDKHESNSLFETNGDFVYPNILTFECIKCGICCGDTNTKKRHILALKHEVEKIAYVTHKNISEFCQATNNHSPYEYELKKKDGKCIFLKQNSCTIYSSRPLICHFFPFRLQPSINSKHRFDYTPECPGIGIGKKIGLQFTQII